MNKNVGSKFGIKAWLLVLVPCLMVLQIVGSLCFATYAEKRDKNKFYGVPIVNETQNLEGKTFHPQAFLYTPRHVLLYNEDGKVYTLDGMVLDGGSRPEQFNGRITNATYYIYRQRDGQLHFHDAELWF